PLPLHDARVRVVRVRLPSIAELRKRYVERGRSLPARVEQALRADPREGAKQILAAVERRRHARRSEGQRLRTIYRYEVALWNDGTTIVAGIDEAGMSPLAGPVAAGAVILPVGCRIEAIDDSKKLDPHTRRRLAERIRTDAVAWSVAFAVPEEIDR